MPSAESFIEGAYKFVSKLILVCAIIAGIAVLLMIAVTVTDVVLRIFNLAIVGAYDIVRVAGVVAIACGLPYVTAVKGHIAIEVFYQNLNRVGRVIVDTIFRVTALVLFGFLVYKSIDYGLSLIATGEVTLTLQIPVFWIPFLISFNFILIFLTVFYHLLRPGKELIKP